MLKYGGTVIHQSQSDQGIVEIVDDRTQRSLHLGSIAKQSSMYLADPARLALSYTRAMLAALLFIDTPSRVLVLGLGGGSLVKFLFQHLPACHIDAVEFREDIVKLAYGYFALPADPRVTVHLSDAHEFVRSAADVYRDYDLILIDVFDAEGLALAVREQGFAHDCAARLHPHGICSYNLWQRPATFDPMMNQLVVETDQEIVLVPVKDKGNVIALAPVDARALKIAPLRERARALEQRLNLEFSQFVRQMRQLDRDRYRHAHPQR